MIGLFNDCFPPIMDGVSVTTSNYAYWLNKRGEKVCVITPSSVATNIKQEYPVYRYLSVPIPMRKPYRLGFPRIDWPFHKQINNLPFELVHAHCPFSSGNLALHIAKTRNIPIIGSFHSKYRADFERIIPNKFIINQLIKSIVHFYEQVDEVWIPQASVEETLREYGYNGKVEVVDNGNDYSNSYTLIERENARNLLCIKPHESLFLFVGQHILEKNIEFLLQSIALIKGACFKLFFIGSGYATAQLKQMTTILGLSSQVSFVGNISDRTELKKYYLAADLFLFPSFYDNAPLVIREAAALHTPSLLLEGATAAEIITNDENGFLSPNSTHEYARCIERIMQNPLLTKQVGYNASKTLTRSWEEITKEVSERYNCLIKKKRL